MKDLAYALPFVGCDSRYCCLGLVLISHDTGVMESFFFVFLCPNKTGKKKFDMLFVFIFVLLDPV